MNFEVSFGSSEPVRLIKKKKRDEIFKFLQDLDS